MCNESLRIDNKNQLLKPMIYLKSTIKNERIASKISGNQLVSVSTECDSNTIWIITKGSVSGAEKFLSNGEPININDKISIQHLMTGHTLYSDIKNNYITDFGNELEVCCLSTRLPGKCHNLSNEQNGTRTINSLSRNALKQNLWNIKQLSLLSSIDSSLSSKSSFSMDSISNEKNMKRLNDNRKLPKLPTSNTILQLIYNKLNQNQNIYELILTNLLSLSSNNNNNNILVDFEDIKWIFKDCNLLNDINDEYYDLLLTSFDINNNGLININEFITSLKNCNKNNNNSK